MHFGEPLDDDRFAALVRPGGGIGTVITADTYGAGRGRPRCSGAALAGVPRDDYALVGAIGHDFYEGEREGAKGFPRFTDPRLRGPEGYARLRADGDRAQPRALRRRRLRPAAAAQPRPHGLHERGRLGRARGRPRRRASPRRLGVAPGPANGFTLDVIDCFERFGERIDWAMVILNPLEPWPGELVLPAAERHGVELITRVVDYGGLFHDDVHPGHPVPASGTTARSARRAGSSAAASGWSACARSPSATA